MAYTPYQKKQPTYPGIFEGVTSDMLAANEGSGTTGKGKAKYTMSKVFDESGETLTETNIDEDGSETKVVKKTPSSLLDNESYDTPILGNDEVTFPSIATPPEEDGNLVYGSGGSSSGRWGGPARAGFMGQTATRPYGPLPNGRYLTEDEYLGTGQASRWLSRPPTESIEPDVFGTGIDVEQSGSENLNDQGTLAITDPDRANAQSSIIESINNQRMMELYNSRPDLYEKVVEGELDMPVIEDPHKDKDYTTPGFDGSTLHSDSVPGSFISETFDRYRNEDGAIVDSPLRSDVFDEDNPLFTTLHPEAAKVVTEEKIKEEEKKLEENFEDLPWAGDKGIDLTAVVQEIKDTDPKAIEVLNEFASWADTVTDEVAIKEAEDYLLSLKESPSVDSRFRKAMAIGMIAMLFGDDFTTAMNTGFGVVADDYAAEAEEAKTEAEAAAALQKTLNAEARANSEWDRRKIINEELDYAKWLRENKLTESKEAKEAAAAITKGNMEWTNNEAKEYWEELKEKGREKFNNVYGFRGEMDRAVDWMNRNWKGLIDFEHNIDQRTAFRNSFEKWMLDKQIFSGADGDAPAFENYIQDAFIKTKFASDATYIEPSLISPDRDTLIKDGQYSQKKVARAKESVANLYKKVQNQIIPAVGTEKHALMLLKKDFNDFKNYEFDGTPVAEGEVSKRYAKLESASYDVGEGVFTRFVNQLPANSVWGMVHDPSAKGKSAKQLQDAIVDYIANN